VEIGVVSRELRKVGIMECWNAGRRKEGNLEWWKDGMLEV